MEVNNHYDSYIIYYKYELTLVKLMVNEEVPHGSNKRGGSAAALVVGIKQIRVSDETWRLLTDLGEFGETYGDIVARVTKHYVSCPELKRKKQKE
jgi:hypothetical protein